MEKNGKGRRNTLREGLDTGKGNMAFGNMESSGVVPAQCH